VLKVSCEERGVLEVVPGEVRRFVRLDECLFTGFDLRLDALRVEDIALVNIREVLHERGQVRELVVEAGHVGHGHVVTLVHYVASVEPRALLPAQDLYQQALNLVDALLVHRYNFLFLLDQYFDLICLPRNFFLLHFIKLLHLSEPVVLLKFRYQVLNRPFLSLFELADGFSKQLVRGQLLQYNDGFLNLVNALRISERLH
jgi:hypothetical protein